MGSNREKLNITIAMNNGTIIQINKQLEIYILHMGSDIDRDLRIDRKIDRQIDRWIEIKIDRQKYRKMETKKIIELTFNQCPKRYSAHIKFNM